MLTERQRISIRRHLGIPFSNTAQAGRLFGWRFSSHVEDIEYKLSNLSPSEEQLITGKSMASFRIGGRPSSGDVLTYTITDPNAGALTIPYTVQSGDLTLPADIVNPAEAAPTYGVAFHSINSINNAITPYGYNAAARMPADLFSPAFLPAYFAQVIILGPGSSTFTISSSIIGTTNFIVEEQGAPCPVRATVNNVTYYGYVDILDALAMQPARADVSLWVKGGTDGDFRSDEVSARNNQYRYYCEMLSRDLGGREYVNRFFSGSSGGATA